MPRSGLHFWRHPDCSGRVYRRTPEQNVCYRRRQWRGHKRFRLGTSVVEGMQQAQVKGQKGQGRARTSCRLRTRARAVRRVVALRPFATRCGARRRRGGGVAHLHCRAKTWRPHGDRRRGGDVTLSLCSMHRSSGGAQRARAGRLLVPVEPRRTLHHLRGSDNPGLGRRECGGCCCCGTRKCRRRGAQARGSCQTRARCQTP
mmetsp:Transcript_15499/g.64355  ORF Transcript_15499/g.64355 Transcript_15499/m.64355 type:complete len:202 (+) Transcript_15499:1085-1690(+)